MHLHLPHGGKHPLLHAALTALGFGAGLACGGPGGAVKGAQLGFQAGKLIDHEQAPRAIATGNPNYFTPDELPGAA